MKLKNIFKRQIKRDFLKGKINFICMKNQIKSSRTTNYLITNQSYLENNLKTPQLNLAILQNCHATKTPPNYRWEIGLIHQLSYIHIIKVKVQ